MVTPGGPGRTPAGKARRLERIDVDATSETVLWISPEARLLDVNLAACRSLGYTRDELLKLSIPDIDPDFTVDKWQHHLEQLRQQGSFRFESTQRAKDGRLFAVEVMCNHVQIGRDERACAFVRDISERKRAESLSQLSHQVTRNLALADSPREVLKAVLRVICESERWESSGYFQREDRDGTSRLIVGWSGPHARPSTKDYYQQAISTVVPPGGVISRVLTEGKPVWIPDLLASHTTWRERIERTGQRTTFGFPVCADGEALGALVFADPAIRKPDEALLETVVAIGEQVGQFIKRKEAEEALRKNEMQLQCMLESTADGMLAVDVQGHVIRTNRRFAELWRIPQAMLDNGSDQALLDHVAGQLVEPEAFMQRVQALYQSDIEATDTIAFKDGRVYERFTSPMRLQQAVVGRVWSFRDITGRKQSEALNASLESQLRESQKMEAIGTLAGGIAHDFNNILSTVLGHAELAQVDSAEHPGIQESLREIRKAGLRARDLVMQILAFSRRQPTLMQPIDLSTVVADAARLLQATLPARMDLKVQCESGMPPVLADATQMLQAILNLATNAMQAMAGDAGTIRVHLDMVTLEAGLVEKYPALTPLRQAHGGRAARLVVSDDGPGMDAATLKRIFEPFFTTRPVNEGTGLGLSVVYGIVQAHGGAIIAESQPGAGARFALYFPAAAGAPEPRTEQTATVDPARAPRLLHIDDDPMPLLLFKRFFERRGYQVSDFTDPNAALEALKADPAAFDLVLTDYKMPGQSGLEVARAVRGIDAQLPVVVVSGFIDETLQAQYLSCGVRALISKSDPVESIIRTVQKYIRSPAIEAPRVHL